MDYSRLVPIRRPCFFALRAVYISLAISFLLAKKIKAQSSGDDNAFIGYTFDNVYSAFKAWYCQPGSTWTSLGTFARCCPTIATECMIATACLNTSLLVGPYSEQIETCSGAGQQTVCLTGTVYNEIGQTQSVVNYDCWPSYTATTPVWFATRTTVDLEVTNTQSSESSSTITSGPSFTAPASNLDTSSTTQGSGSSVRSGSSGISPGVVAGISVGAVVGTLSAVAILAVLFLVHLRRKPTRAEAPERARDIIYVQPANTQPLHYGGVEDYGRRELEVLTPDGIRRAGRPETTSDANDSP